MSLAAARLGYEVTPLDISAGMLTELQRAASIEGLRVQTVCGSAHEPPPGPFDAVVERLVLWTLPTREAPLRRGAKWLPGSLLPVEDDARHAVGS